MNRFFIFGLVMLVAMSTNNAFATKQYSGTCSGEVLISEEYGTAGDEYCCSLTTQEDFVGGYARGYTEADGSVKCCKYIECPDGPSTNDYCRNIYRRLDPSYTTGAPRDNAMTIQMRVCSYVNGQNVLKCDAPYLWRDTGTYNNASYYTCVGCSNVNPNPSSGTYGSWSAAYMDTTKQKTGNTSWQDCRLVANRTESGCTNNIVPDYFGLSGSTWDPYSSSAWVHKSYGWFTAQAGYKKNTSSGTCTLCGEHEYSPGGDITSCGQCPYYSATPPSPPWGPSGWSGCEPIIAGLNSNQTLATQGIGTGDTCAVGSSTGSNSYGDFVAGACNNTSAFDFSHTYTLYISVSHTYCQHTASDWASRICVNAMHCSGNACAGCANGLLANVTPDGRIYINRYNLYDAQILLSQIASATSLGCLQSCSIN